MVIIASYVDLDNAEARSWDPHLVFVDERNRIKADSKVANLSALS